MSVQFLRILGVRAKQPGIVALVDGEHLVKWDPLRGWYCPCPNGNRCAHPDAVEALLLPAVLDGWE